MTIFQECLAYLLKFHPEWWSYLKVEEWKYKDPQNGLQNQPQYPRITLSLFDNQLFHP